MEISLVITKGAKQIMMTPENDHEKECLKMIGTGETLQVATKWGTFDDKPQISNFNISKCKGGYYRRFAQQDSLMFIIEQKKDSDVETCPNCIDPDIEIPKASNGECGVCAGKGTIEWRDAGITLK